MGNPRCARGAILAVLLSGAIVGACAKQRGTTAWTVTVDTVGQTVRVTNTPPESGARPTMVGEEDLRIGTVEGGGPTSFGMIRTIAVLPDERIAVADATTEEVRLFDRKGKYLRTFGGKGAGPGDLQGMEGVYVDRRGLLRVPEDRNARMSIFDPDSGYLRSYPLRLFTTRGRGLWEAAFDSAGRTLVASSGQFGKGRDWLMLRVYDSTMTQLDSVPYHDYTDEIRSTDRPGVWIIAMRNGRLYIRVPFYPVPPETLSPAGTFWTSAEGASQLEVARWTPPSDTTLVIYSQRPPRPVTASERDSAVAAISAEMGGRMPSGVKLDPSKIPSFKPPTYGLSLDDRGRLWVRVTGEETDPTLYDVFNPDGHHAETVTLPSRVDIWLPPIVRGDTLWAVTVDDNDVQHVVRAHLRRLGEG